MLNINKVFLTFLALSISVFSFPIHAYAQDSFPALTQDWQLEHKLEFNVGGAGTSTSESLVSVEYEGDRLILVGNRDPQLYRYSEVDNSLFLLDSIDFASGTFRQWSAATFIGNAYFCGSTISDSAAITCLQWNGTSLTNVISITGGGGNGLAPQLIVDNDHGNLNIMYYDVTASEYRLYEFDGVSVSQTGSASGTTSGIRQSGLTRDLFRLPEVADGGFFVVSNDSGLDIIDWKPSDAVGNRLALITNFNLPPEFLGVAPYQTQFALDDREGDVNGLWYVIPSSLHETVNNLLFINGNDQNIEFENEVNGTEITAAESLVHSDTIAAVVTAQQDATLSLWSFHDDTQQINFESNVNYPSAARAKDSLSIWTEFLQGNNYLYVASGDGAENLQIFRANLTPSDMVTLDDALGDWGIALISITAVGALFAIGAKIGIPVLPMLAFGATGGLILFATETLPMVLLLVIVITVGGVMVLKIVLNARQGED